VLNWDCINKDPVYRSLESYNFFEHYKPDMNRWVGGFGNVILVENQTIDGRPSQESYDIFTQDYYLDDKFGVEVSENSSIGSKAYVNNSVSNPIIEGLGNKITLEQSFLYNSKWFPEKLTNNLPSMEFETVQKRLYSGWFTDWDDEWVPLIFADGNKEKPVMLARFTGNPDKEDYIGVYVVSTMYIGSSYNDQVHKLIKNIFTLSSDSEQKLARIFEQKKEIENRRIKYIGSIIGLVITGLGIGISTWLSNISISTILASIVTGVISAVFYYIVELVIQSRNLDSEENTNSYGD
jgi:hypothetical protein